MTPAAEPVAAGAPRCTCTACPLVCDDILPADGRFDRACDVGRTRLADTGPAADEPAAWSDGRPVAPAVALAAAARHLAAARRVLVTGFGGATLEAVVRAFDIADALGAAVDAGDAEADRPAGPTIARVGEVTADWEELRDRADLVIFWLCDPDSGHPRFHERFLAPPVGDTPRRSLVVGPAWVSPPPQPHDWLPLAPDAGVEAARCLDVLLGGRRLPGSFPAADAAVAAVAVALAAAIDAARCVAIVTAHDADPVGLAAWSMAHVVRTIAHVKPAFEVPLGGHGPADARPAGAKGAAAVSAWRYGAAGAIDWADPAGAVFLPGEASARRLIERGEVDAVIVVGRPTQAVAAALARAGGIAMVRIDDGRIDDGRIADGRSGDTPPAATGPRTIHLRCANTVAETPGTMLRGDGRTVSLLPARPARLPLLADLLAELAAAVTAALPAAPTGRRGMPARSTILAAATGAVP